MVTHPPLARLVEDVLWQRAMMRWTLISLCALSSLLGCVKKSEPEKQKEEVEVSDAKAPPLGQLPGDVLPLAYRLDLTLVPDQERFSGVVEIDVDVKQPTQRIFLHGRRLDVSVARAGKVDGAFTELTETGAGELVLDEKIPVGKTTLHFEYTAPFNRALEGIYRVDEGGESYAFSQMEAISARLAFPCFDEPRFKVPFDLSVTARAEHVVITNTPELEKKVLDDGMVKHTFAKTQPLPTYLLAFAVGPLDVVDWDPIPPTELRDRPIPLRGASAKGKGERLKLALADTGLLVTTLESYFGIAYPYAKLDLIAAPDYAFGAMENAGAIVYREERLLLDEDSPIEQIQAYFGTHSHELAHQWFGDLVTPEWWTDIWLNESFATWMGNRATDVAKPDSEYGRKILRRAMAVMDEDGLASARRIREPVVRDEQIWNAFDGITYSKGGGVLAMFESYLGEEAFREGVRLHMKRFAHGVANAEDFAKSLADGSKQPEVVDAFRTFVEQPGIPRVEVEARCEDGKGSLALTQSRYAPLGSSIDSDTVWGIPFCYATFNGKTRSANECQLIEKASQTLALEACFDAVLPNAGGAGYYHFVLEGGFEPLLERFASLSPEEQLATFSSIEAAFRAGDAPLETALAVSRAAVASKHWDVQLAPFDLLWQLSRDFGSQEAAELIQSLYRPTIERIGLAEREKDTLGDRLKRSTLVKLLAMAGRDEKVRTELEALADRHLAGKTTPAETPVAALALAVAAQERRAPFVKTLRSKLSTERDGYRRSEMVFALANAKDADDVLPLLLEGELRTNERIVLLRTLFEYEHPEATLGWLEQNFRALADSLPSQFHGRVFSGTAEMCDEGAIETVAGFQSSASDLRGVDLELAQAKEAVELCVALKKGVNTRKAPSPETVR